MKDLLSQKSLQKLQSIKFELESPKVVAPRGFHQVRRFSEIDIDKKIFTKVLDRMFSFPWRTFREHPNCTWYQEN